MAKKKASKRKKTTGKERPAKPGKKKVTRKKKKKAVAKKAAGKARKKAPERTTRERVVPAVVVKRVKRPVPSWPTEKEWRQSGLCSEAQADGIPCTALGRHCEICERADQKDAHGG